MFSSDFFYSKPMFSSFVQWNYSHSIFNNIIIGSTFKLLQWELNVIYKQTLFSYLLLCFCNPRNRCLCNRLGSWKEWHTYWWHMDSGGSRAQYKLELLKSWKNLSKVIFPNHLFYYVSIRPCTPIFWNWCCDLK